MDRTMIKVSFGLDGVEFRTFSRIKRESRVFFVFYDMFEQLEAHGYSTQRSSQSYATFHLDGFKKTVSIQFAWIRPRGNYLAGWKETVVLDYETLMTFVQANTMGSGPREWKCLDILPCTKQPQFVFRCQERLRECLENKLIRRKLVKFLRNNFKWPYTERIEFYSDFVPYSFFFREFRGDTPIMYGGVILHGQDDMAKAYYSIDT